MKHTIRSRWIPSSIVLFVLSLMILILSDTLWAAKKPPANEETSQAVVEDNEAVAIFDDFDAAEKRSRLSQRPLLAVFGADWCGWCRKLESEIASEQGEAILKTWVIVKIDIDKKPDLAIDYGVSGVPALRVLDLENIAIAGMDGYVPIEQLKEWLQEQMTIANPKIQQVLYAEGKPSESDLDTLLEFLGHRTSSLRNAAAERLIRSREQTAQVVVETLRTGKLGQQLAALQILRTWQAPVDGLDPWTPDSLEEASVQPLLEWLSNHSKESTVDRDPQAPAALDAAKADSILAALTQTPTGTNMSEAVRYGEALLPHVAARLGKASELDDTAHETLRELNYRLLAGDQLRLEDTSLLKSLASLDAETHRAAAEKILPQITAQDQPLLDALSNDLNPIIRERSIPIQQKCGALRDIDRLRKLLADSSPSVRTAILRELSEHPESQSIAALIAYLNEETDENLLVFATKTLGAVGAKKGGIKNEAEKALVDLSSNSSWRVRAAAIDAIGQIVEKGRYGGVNPSISTTLANAVLKATSDEDPFVASRAEPLVIRAVNSETAEGVAKFLVSHPDRIKELTKEISEYEKEKIYTPIVEAAKVWLDSDQASEVRNATTLITRLQPKLLQSQLPRLFTSDDLDTRIAAYEAFIASLHAMRDQEVKAEQQTIENDSIEAQSWHEVPESFRSLPTDTKSRGVKEEPEPPAETSGLNLFSFLFGTSQATAKPNRPAPETSVPNETRSAETSTAKESKKEDLSVVDDFFGTTPSPMPAKAEPEAEITELKPNADRASLLDDDAIGLPSRWLTKWQQSSSLRQSFDWIEPIQTEIQRKLDSLDGQLDSSNIEHQWLNAVAMAAGHTERSGAVVKSLLTSSLNREAESIGPPPNLLISWLAPEDRRQWLFQQMVDWKEPTPADYVFLKAATEVDDLQVADWLLQGMNGLSANQLAMIQPYLLRALFGSEADSYNEHIYESRSQYNANQTDSVPGRIRAEEWLRAKYHATTDDAIRSVLLALLSYVDHDVAVASAVGFVAQAKQPSPLLEIALHLALHDKIELSVDRAIQWLVHPLPEVSTQALRRLGNTASSSGNPFGSGIRAVTVWQLNNELPGVWYSRRPLPKQPLEMLSKQETDEAILAKILLLAIKDESPQATKIENDLNTDATRLLLCTVLSLAERVDAEAMRIYQQTSDKLSENQDVRSFYSLLQNLPGEEVRTLRTEFRKKFGSILANPF